MSPTAPRLFQSGIRNPEGILVQQVAFVLKLLLFGLVQIIPSIVAHAMRQKSTLYYIHISTMRVFSKRTVDFSLHPLQF